MQRQSCPDWLREVLDQLYNEQAAQVNRQPDIHALNQAQQKLEEELKKALTYSQFQHVLEWEEIMNHRSTLEIEAMYQAGIKSGMRMLLDLQQFITE